MKPIVLLLAICALAAAQDFDLLIRGGHIVDGTGNPAFYGDIGIRQGRIAAMGRLAGHTAARTIEAKGLTVSPGFIDMHNHSDFTLIEDGNAQSMIRQGVTTMILGEGGSAAPSGRWKDFASYFAQLMRQGFPPTLPPTSAPARSGPRCTANGPVRLLPGNWTDARPGEGSHGAGSAGRGQFLERAARFVDRYGYAGRDVRGRSAYGGRYSTHLRTEGKGVFEAVAEAIEIAGVRTCRWILSTSRSRSTACGVRCRSYLQHRQRTRARRGRTG